ncbi:MAG TPA: glycosyl hydrolase family 28-related protein [Streptosporangiaceae bacterium]|jgi:hypothetical protein
MLATAATGLLAGAGGVALGSAATSGSPALAATVATPDWINVVSYGADPTGATDSTAAIKKAIAALPAAGGLIYLPAGKYKVSSVLTCTKVPAYFVGDGFWATVVEFTGTGDCFRVYDSTTYGDRTRFAGGFRGLTIDGSKAKGKATGLHVGDLLQYELDLTVQNFSAAGSIGVHLDNNYYWTEQLFGRIYAQYCNSHVVFDWTSATASTSSGSFERCELDVYINQDSADFDGVVLQNGAYISNGSLRLRGNFGSSSSTVTSAALRLTGQQDVNGYNCVSGITAGLLDIGVECGAGAHTPQTIAFGSAANSIYDCYGALNFGAAGNTFAPSNNDGNIGSFQGMVSGDSTLPGQWATYNTGLPSGWSGEVSFRELPTGHEVMVSWELTIAAGTTVTSGTPVVTVDTKFGYAGNKVIPANIAGADLTGNVYAAAYITSNSKAAPVFQYDGPAFEGSAPAYWFGQGVYTLSLG